MANMAQGEGWMQAPGNGRRHYFRNGRSLCRAVIAGEAAQLTKTAPNDGWNCASCVELKGLL